MASSPPERSVQLIRGWLGGRREDMFRNVFTFRTKVLHSHRDHPGGRVIANSLAVGIHAELLELKDLLKLDLTVLDAGDLGHADDPAHATSETRLLREHVDRGPDGLPDG